MVISYIKHNTQSKAIVIYCLLYVSVQQDHSDNTSRNINVTLDKVWDIKNVFL